MRLNILLCDTFPGLLPVYIPSYKSMFTRLFDATEAEWEYRVYRTLEGELPEIDGNDALNLIPGCHMGAYDRVPWIEELLGWIRNAHRAELKMMGVCFGHQAIAQALGGKVEKAAVGWGTGVRESNVVDAEAQRYFTDHKMRLLYNHHDQVMKLPAEAQLVAESDFCPVESYRIGNHILTFQGHPEYTPEYAYYLIRSHTYNEPLPVRQAALASLTQMQHQGDVAARWVTEWCRE